MDLGGVGEKWEQMFSKCIAQNSSIIEKELNLQVLIDIFKC